MSVRLKRLGETPAAATEEPAWERAAVRQAVCRLRYVELARHLWDFQIMAANEGLARLCRTPLRQLPGRWYSHLCHPDDLDAVRLLALLRLYGEAPTGSRYRYRLGRPGGPWQWVMETVS